MNSITVINTLSVKPGKMDDFIKIHAAFSREFASTCVGLVGGRMYRSLDGSTAVLISEFESIEAQERIVNRPEVRENVKALQQFVEQSRPVVLEMAYAYGGPPTTPP